MKVGEVKNKKKFLCGSILHVFIGFVVVVIIIIIHNAQPFVPRVDSIEKGNKSPKPNTEKWSRLGYIPLN